MADKGRRGRTRRFQEIEATDGEVFEKGDHVCVNTATGLATKAATNTTLIPRGYCHEGMTGGNNRKVLLELYSEYVNRAFNNDDAGTPVTNAMIGQTVYFLDSETVTADATGASVAGTVFAVEGPEVLVLPRKV